jgi:hypothetical protein
VFTYPLSTFYLSTMFIIGLVWQQIA